MKKFLLVTAALLLAMTPAMAGEHPSLPKEMVGEWCPASKDSDEYERRSCSKEEASFSNSPMTLGKHNVHFWEEVCNFTKVQKLDRNVYYVHGNCEGEERTWKDSMIFSFLPNGHIRVVVTAHSKEKDTP